MSAPKVGDRMILRSLRRGQDADREVVVYKVGRKWGHAKPEDATWPDVKFDLETGYEDARGYSSMVRLITPEQDADGKRRDAAWKAIEVGGLTRNYSTGGARDVPTEALERIAAILTGGAA